MSSSVISPCTSPYSSTTSASCALRLRNSLSWSVTLVVSGTNQGGAARPGTSSLATSQPTRASATSRSLVCRTPTMFSGSSFHRGMRVCWLFSTSSTTFCGGSSMLMVCILVRCTMMSSTCRLLRSSTPPSMAASPLATAPPMVLQLDGAADLLVRGQDIGGIVALGRRELQDQADDELDRRRSAD